MEEPRSLQADVPFGQGTHTVRVSLSPTSLGVEVEAPTTGDQWRGEFDTVFIEELTRKTGNFKQFGIFCSMLEAALLKSSGCVSLELLSYGDLETLRSQKRGGLGWAPPPVPPSLGAKRYLILVYNVEFDRIHYPLPLPYAGGGSDRDPPASLRLQVRSLRQELERLRFQRDSEIRELREELRRVREAEPGAEPELRGVRAELERERNRHRRERRRLEGELAEARAAQQRLQQQVRALRAELLSCRRGHRTPAGPERSSTTRGGNRGRSPSPAAPPRFDPTSYIRARQLRQQELKNQRRGGAFGSTSPARSRGRSSSAESFRSRRSVGSETEEPSQPPRGRRVTQRPLSTSSCNGPSRGRTHKPPTGKPPGKENDLAEIDARLVALQDYMARLVT